MRVIFLDVDGVLINRDACRRGFGVVDPSCVATLNDLLEKSGAFIVVSSCWRIGREVMELKDLFNEWGVLRGRVLDKTPHDWEKKRGDEIQMWLDERKEHRGDVDSFVIIDDDSDMEHLMPFLVKTKFEFGIQPEHVEQALAMLS